MGACDQLEDMVARMLHPLHCRCCRDSASLATSIGAALGDHVTQGGLGNLCSPKAEKHTQLTQLGTAKPPMEVGGGHKQAAGGSAITAKHITLPGVCESHPAKRQTTETIHEQAASTRDESAHPTPSLGENKVIRGRPGTVSNPPHPIPPLRAKMFKSTSQYGEIGWGCKRKILVPHLKGPENPVTPCVYTQNALFLGGHFL